MTVNTDVELAVRAAFAGAVAQDPEKFESAFESVADKGDRFAAEAVNLALAVGTLALLDIHEGQRPDADQVNYLVHSFLESESWAEIEEDAARKYLTALTDQTPVLDVLPPGDVAQLAFVVGAWLLSAFPPEERAWTDFLDQLLDKLESAPAQQ